MLIGSSLCALPLRRTRVFSTDISETWKDMWHRAAMDFNCIPYNVLSVLLEVDVTVGKHLFLIEKCNNMKPEQVFLVSV